MIEMLHQNQINTSNIHYHGKFMITKALVLYNDSHFHKRYLVSLSNLISKLTILYQLKFQKQPYISFNIDNCDMILIL